MTDTISDRSYQLRLIALGIRRGIPPEKAGAEVLEAVAEYLDWLEEEMWTENERLRDEVYRGRVRAGDGDVGSTGEQEGDGYMPADKRTEGWNNHSSYRRDDQVLHAPTNEDPSTVDGSHVATQVEGEAMHDTHLADGAKRSTKSN